MGIHQVNAVILARKSAKLGLATLAVGLAIHTGGLLLPAEAAPAAKKSTVNLQRGRTLFNDWSCGTCHVLKDAGATGQVGPSLDGNRSLTKAFVVNRITHGAGAMPGFGGQLSDAEIAELSGYIVQVAKK
jgi:mono/diheme cytochrome c family protein